MTFPTIPEGRRAFADRLEALARTNPLFGPRRLKLGTFCTNVSNGATMSSAEGVYQLSWPNVRSTAGLADEMGFEAIVPIARWLGFEGATNFNAEVFEPMAFSAGVSAITASPSVFATMHVPAMHPVMAAKQAVTIDHISGGRFSLNVVTGWNRREIELFGTPLLEHDARFAVAEEWITLMKLLWTSPDPVTFEGSSYRVKGAKLRPFPIQPYPALMNASNSDIGKRFAAKHFDILFVALSTRDPAEVRSKVAALRDMANTEFGRDIKIWINAYMVIGDTQEDAEKQFHHVIHEKGDWAAAESMIREMGITVHGKTQELMERQKPHTMAGYNGFQLLGTPERIVEDMTMLSDAGIDGVLLSWPAYLAGMRRFQAQVHPLLAEAGLR